MRICCYLPAVLYRAHELAKRMHSDPIAFCPILSFYQPRYFVGHFAVHAPVVLICR